MSIIDCLCLLVNLLVIMLFMWLQWIFSRTLTGYLIRKSCHIISLNLLQHLKYLFCDVSITLTYTAVFSFICLLFFIMYLTENKHYLNGTVSNKHLRCFRVSCWEISWCWSIYIRLNLQFLKLIQTKYMLKSYH